MSNRKIRILFSGEASYLSTGYATYNREIMKRIHNSGKYEIAEYGSYGSEHSPEAKKLPWKFYGVLPTTEQEKQEYHKSKLNEFGAYKLDAVLADFQPDVVIDPRDPWMFQHLVKTRFRDNFKLILMPTVDSAPQKKEWIKEIFSKADVLTTYSRFGKKTLEEQGLSVQAVTSPGIDLDIFRPLDKSEIRDKFQIASSLFVFGTVMRNQKRKLFPDLFDAYKKLRDKYTNVALVRRIKKKNKEKKPLSKKEKNAMKIHHSVLYCHTSWPDVGWDLPGLLARYQLQRHVIFTYKCEACDMVYADWFAPCDQNGMRMCRICGERKAHMPNTHSGVSEEKLVEIFNLFDVYLQPAICEGWGLPIVESKACGVPGMYQDYSAMEDHVENGGGKPIKIGRFYHEAETASVRSLPDIDDIVKGMEKYAFNDGFRERKAEEARKCAEKMHSWELSVEKFISIIDSLDLPDRDDTWNRRPIIKDVCRLAPPDKLSDIDFVVWLYINVLGRQPDEPGLNNWLANLKNGGSRESIHSYFINEILSENKFEQVRWHKSLRLRGLEPEEEPRAKKSIGVLL